MTRATEVLTDIKTFALSSRMITTYGRTHFKQGSLHVSLKAVIVT